MLSFCRTHPVTFFSFEKFLVDVSIGMQREDASTRLTRTRGVVGAVHSYTVEHPGGGQALAVGHNLLPFLRGSPRPRLPTQSMHQIWTCLQHEGPDRLGLWFAAPGM